MATLAMLHWGFLLGAALIGLLAGWIAVVQRGTGLSRRGLQLAAALVVALLVVSFMRLLPDRAGYWLDLALVMFGLYLGGCTVGSLLRGLVVARGMPPSP